MKRRSVIKIENFLITNTATLGVFAWSFIRCWAIPVRSLVDARRAARGNPRRFGVAYSTSYNDRVTELAEKPIKTYAKYYALGKQRLKKLGEIQK